MADGSDNGADLTVDVAISGGGMVGLTLAVALASAGLEVAVVERDRPVSGGADESDGRVSAISRGSRQVFEVLGLWREMARVAQPVWDIRVTEGASPCLVRLDGDEVGHDALGHVVENRTVIAVLRDAAAGTPRVTLLAPGEVSEIARGPHGAVVTLADGRRVGAHLLVGADGRASFVRREARIGQTEWRYSQKAIVTTVAHDRPHGGVAEERFLPSGPFAILPMTDGAGGAHRSSVVWTERDSLADALMDLGEQEFEAELAARCGAHLGAVATMGPRRSYPLGLMLAGAYTGHRVALIGDAAHGIHPIAGQGLNLGVRDAAALAEVIVDARRLGLDCGMASVLAEYERWRRVDNFFLAAATDVLNRLFSTTVTPVALARRAGFTLFNRLRPARRLLMREGMGVTGDLPRLVRGEAL